VALPCGLHVAKWAFDSAIITSTQKALLVLVKWDEWAFFESSIFFLFVFHQVFFVAAKIIKNPLLSKKKLLEESEQTILNVL
jgi:hypothetical protein